MLLLLDDTGRTHEVFHGRFVGFGACGRKNVNMNPEES